MAAREFKGEEPENLEEKCCCVLVVDTSVSMEGTPIDQLNAGLKAFADEIRELKHLRHRLEVAIVEFNSAVRTVLEPTLGINLAMPTLSTAGSTKLVDGAFEAIQFARGRTRWYDDTGQPRKRPWIILITDGRPDSGQDIARLKREIEAAEAAKEFIFLPIGVDGADMDFLKMISMKNSELQPKHISSTKFSEFFRWVSDLMGKVVDSRPGEKLLLPKEEFSQGVEV
jgi:uncharacterized protein YegL